MSPPSNSQADSIVTLLPTEIIEVILRNLYYRADDWTSTPDYATLCACSLIHRSWTLPAQHLLYHHLSLKKITRLSAFTDFCRSSESLHDKGLLNHVRLLDLLIAPDVGTLKSTFPHFVHLLSILPRLYSISIWLVGLVTIPTPLRASIQAVVASTNISIRALRIMECSVQAPILYELLALFPTVKCLHIGPEIRSLPSHVLEWILAHTQDTLRILELFDSVRSDTISTFERVGPGIHSLRIMRYDSNTAQVLRCCTQLRELIMQPTPPLVRLTLPRSIERVNIANWYYNQHHSMTDWTLYVDAVLHGPGPITFQCDKDSSSNGREGFLALEAACRKTGATLELQPRNWWPNEDPVVVSSFPRGRTTDNFPLMN
ncbi:hypothetical protein BDZ89DRAFT_1067772 [Hymenopellis radicata]|nr:hypothetical protein BDZ89DRAFT_1067772 [Hymenopellis radicata]